VLGALAVEGPAGVTARIRRRWRLWTFRPHVVDKQVDDFRFKFYIGTSEGQEWYGAFVDTRLYKSIGPELAWLRQAVAAGDTVADVGAHHGYFALLLSHWVGERGRVFAFESLPQNAEIAERNMALNGVSNVRIIQSAVGASVGAVAIARDSSGVLSANAAATDALTVHVVALDEVFDQNLPDLLKIDVEGYELEVLRGARRCLAARPKIALEFHCFRFQDPVRRVGEILSLLPNEGYRYELARESGGPLEAFSIDQGSAAIIGAQYNPHLYGAPVMP
jgi:FkbM family methyltransferase